MSTGYVLSGVSGQEIVDAITAGEMNITISIIDEEQQSVCITDGSNYVWLQVDEVPYALFEAYAGNDAMTMLETIAERWGTVTYIQA